VNDDSQTHAILGAAVEIHRTLGPGFLETVYQEALCVELQQRSIPFCRQIPIPVDYKADKLNCGYRADLVCFDHILVELKAQRALSEVDEAQVINYLRATDLEKALLLNFGAARLEIKRLILTADYKVRRYSMKPE